MNINIKHKTITYMNIYELFHILYIKTITVVKQRGNPGVSPLCGMLSYHIFYHVSLGDGLCFKGRRGRVEFNPSKIISTR